MSKSVPTILITGAGGYIGSETIKALATGPASEKPQHIVGLDVRDCPPYLEGYKDFTYLKSDVRDSGMAEIMKKYDVQIVVHLASIVTPPKNSNREFEYSVDVLGTKNVLDCCLKAGVKKVIITSSGAAYGYYADNPAWLKETDALRGNYEFPYSDHKRIVEEMLAEYRTKYPELKQIIFRPGTVIGKNTKNQITDLFQRPIIIGITGSNSPFVFIWDQDVVGCIVHGITTDRTGIYNLAGDGALPIQEIAKIMKKRYVPIPEKILAAALTVLKKVGLTELGPERIRFLQYRPVLANDNLKSGFGYIPKKTSKEAFLYYLENRQ